MDSITLLQEVKFQGAEAPGTLTSLYELFRQIPDLHGENDTTWLGY